MILLIDNNDSFTYNITETLRSITSQKVEVVRHDRVNMQQVAGYDKIIFSPGPSVPQEYPVMEEILRLYGDTVPILGICLGFQAICLHYGGSLVNMEKVIHGVPSLIRCAENSVLFKGIEQTTVGRYHSWIVGDLPDELKITAATTDGIIMAVEHRSKPVYGVQFHPESYISTDGRKILKNFTGL